jgi:hypothetical protein
MLILLNWQNTFSQKKYISQAIQKSDKPKIDGLSNDACWTNLAVAKDFIQLQPNAGGLATHHTEVKMCYTSNAIYIFAKMYQSKQSIFKRLTERDGLSNANCEVFTLMLDPYNDKLNGYAFQVSSANVQMDVRLINGGDGADNDRSWDAIWTSKVKIVEDAWQVEIEIPLSAIRFSEDKLDQWGLNFSRVTRGIRELSFWNKINPQQSGYLAQSGSLIGLENLKQAKNIMLFPYASSGIQHDVKEKTTTNTWLRNGGMDLKIGLSEAFTMDVTLIPDFTQVRSDNILRNLSPFEQQLSENRPFFTEGVELFNKQNLFYSRRLGKRPDKYYNIENTYGDTSIYTIEKNPSTTSLYNATKISGRTTKDLGIGMLNAISAPTNATVYNKYTNENTKIKTSALRNYNIFVLDQSLKHQSYVNFTNTNVYDADNKTVNNVSGIKTKLYTPKENYAFNANVVLSKVLDEVGTKTDIGFEKTAGKLQWGIIHRYTSPQYDQTAAGLQFIFNQMEEKIWITYKEIHPKKVQTYLFNTSHSFKQNIEPLVNKSYEFSTKYLVIFKNFWDVAIEIEGQPFKRLDFFNLRAWNKRLVNYGYVFSSIGGSTDSRKKLFWSYYVGNGISTTKGQGNYFYSESSLRYQVNNNCQVEILGQLTLDDGGVGYSTSNPLGEPIVAKRNVHEYTSGISFQYNISPELSINSTFRHYNSFIKNKSFHTVANDGEWLNNQIAYQPGLNENFNVQNIDVFVNWIFKPGSRFVLSYKQWLGNQYILNDKLDNKYFTNVYQIIKSPKSFQLVARAIFFIDYNKITKRN